MQSPVLTTIAITGFSVAFFHAAIPTHWLPFVLVSRARGWSRAKTLAVTVFAGMGHVTLTSLLGLAIAWFGFQLDEHAGEMFTWIVGGLLIAIGAYYFWQQVRGVACGTTILSAANIGRARRAVMIMRRRTVIGTPS